MPHIKNPGQLQQPEQHDAGTLHDVTALLPGAPPICVPSTKSSQLPLSETVLDILGMILAGKSLHEVMLSVARFVESQGEDFLCSVWLLEEDRVHMRCIAAPNLPNSYIAAIDGFEVGPNCGTCGEAVNQRRPVFVEDILSDPIFEQVRDVTAAHGLRACWSAPIMSHEDEILGTFAMYFRSTRSPSPSDIQLIESASRIAGIAIERHRAEEQIRVLKDQLYKENLALRDEVDRASMFEEIVGNSSALQTVLSRVAKVAPTDSTVLITGETGTGKELIARAVHRRSTRSERAFVSVNCAALAPSLVSSELFGHEKGAFTGAMQRRLGRFELADGGTIFLDEVGELPADTQVALLRVLQEREFERVGGAQPIQVDVRVIAATNRDLEAATTSGIFRSDLFYRLNVFPIEVPPLRERKDDVLMLLEYFVKRYASKAGKDIRRIEKRTFELFQSYDWPGNIRELQNVIERSVILSSGDIFSVDEAWLSKEPIRARSVVPASQPTISESHGERDIIESALRESRGRVSGPSGAAAKLRIPPSTLESKIKALNIHKDRFKLS